MQRFKLTIEYDGRPYVGWQRQKNGPSVQEAIENAVRSFTDNEVIVQGSGRTDSGVHAMGQVAHVDIAREMTPEKVEGAINFYLQEEPTTVLKVEAVSSDFNARFGAKKRHYTYKILNRRGAPTFQRGLVWLVREPLDVDAMRRGAAHLVGHHDFTTFRNVACQAKSPIKTLDYINIEQVGDEIHFHIGAQSFLHNQVRSMVGSLKVVGSGKWDPMDIKKALEAKDRTALGHNAPSGGLYFRHVEYD